MDDQLKQSALDFHEFPVPGKIQVSPTKPLATQRDRRWPTRRAWRHRVSKLKRSAGRLQIYRARQPVAVISNGTAVLGRATLVRWPVSL